VEKGNPLSIPENYLKESQSPNFRWLGWRNDVKEILSVSDVVLLLSNLGEGLPRSLLEGMAMGKPVIATNVIGCKDVIEEGKNGFLVGVGNINEIAALLIKLSLDPSLRKSIGMYAREKAEKEYNIITVNNRIISELYQIKT
jgi:N,N'-diacetylbacillosaminyl-diphospho-undecaprenol alpha-1,3-N-acetylgalactosaminyltransferase